jgi:hypothetical protein
MVRRGEDLRSQKRAGRAVARRMRTEILTAAREAWRPLALLVLGAMLLAGCIGWLMLVLGVDRFLAGVLTGIALGSVLFFWQVFLNAHGFAHRGLGADAERWTAEELGKLNRRRWAVFHDVPLTYGNIDHVVVGPGRIYAVETKWTGSRGRYRDGARQQAARQARKLEEALKQLGVERTVLPILVLWGPKTLVELGESPKLEDGVRVVAGRASANWRARIEAAADRLELDAPALRAVEQLMSGVASEPQPS